jgi:hypothetical protein
MLHEVIGNDHDGLLNKDENRKACPTTYLYDSSFKTCPYNTISHHRLIFWHMKITADAKVLPHLIYFMKCVFARKRIV